MCRGVRELECMCAPAPQKVFPLHPSTAGERRSNGEDESVIVPVMKAAPTDHSMSSSRHVLQVVAQLEAAPAGLAIVAAMAGSDDQLDDESAPATTPMRGAITKLHFSSQEQKQRTTGGDVANNLPRAGWQSVASGRPRCESSDAVPIRKQKKKARKSSIFCSVFSPPAETDYDVVEMMMSRRAPRPCADFMGTCFLCERPLGSGIDIYMYRGDRAFCSNECRYQHIVEDELSERAQQKSLPACVENRAAAPASSPIRPIPVLG
ncbi:hypothetical protein L7F22_047746 [Adiantum nelumboides]|nr:hypothetical protein [Adiantum nelumboides]